MNLRNITDVLSRDEMKKIKGGAINCSGSSGGQTISGACSGSTVSACVGYCVNMGYSGCSCTAMQ